MADGKDRPSRFGFSRDVVYSCRPMEFPTTRHRSARGGARAARWTHRPHKFFSEGEWWEIHRAKSKRGHAQGKEKGASITPRSNPRHCASGDTPRGGPIAPSCALRAHARENAAAARAKSPPGTGRRLVLRPGHRRTVPVFWARRPASQRALPVPVRNSALWRCPRVGSIGIGACECARSRHRPRE